MGCVKWRQGGGGGVFGRRGVVFAIAGEPGFHDGDEAAGILLFDGVAGLEEAVHAADAGDDAGGAFELGGGAAGGAAVEGLARECIEAGALLELGDLREHLASVVSKLGGIGGLLDLVAGFIGYRVVVHEAGDGDAELAGGVVAGLGGGAELEKNGAGLRVLHEGLDNGADAWRVGAGLEAVHVAPGRAGAGAAAATGHGGSPSVVQRFSC